MGSVDRRIRWALVVVWMVVIFAFSSQPYSGRFTGAYLGEFNVAVRKCCHVGEYMVLFLLVFWSLSSERHHRRHLLLALLLTVLYAASDEWHQGFVPGRSAGIRDVLVDSGGALLGLVLCHLRWRYYDSRP